MFATLILFSVTEVFIISDSDGSFFIIVKCLVLVVIVMFVPRGIAGIGRSVRTLWQGDKRG